jgi:hypothetical protein
MVDFSSGTSSEGKVLERRATPSARAADDGALETDDENQSFFSAFLESFSSLLLKKKLIKNDDF